MSIHTTKWTRVVALVGGTGLVIASSGFGAVYAYTVGIQHGIVLAGLTITFAVALELIKPLAVHGAFVAWGSWRTWGKALALSILGLVAVAYSLTAELALTASSRGDLVASREHASDASTRAKERHQRAKAELGTLKPSRPTGELEALIEAKEAKRQSTTALEAELGRAKRKAELEGMLERSEDTLAVTPAVKSSDPGATALATYLGTMGIAVAVETLGQYLILVPVLALELGSALAMVLVASLSPSVKEPQIQIVEPRGSHAMVPDIPLLTDRSTRQRDAVARLIENHLRDHGGSVNGSERSLAKAVGTSKPTLRRALQSMAASGALALNSSKRGTVLTLLA